MTVFRSGALMKPILRSADVKRKQGLENTLADGECVHAHVWSAWIRLLPIVFFLTYLNFTIFLFAFGPWPYPVHDGTNLYFFLACAHLALFCGYLSAAFKNAGGYYGRYSIHRLIVLSIFINLLFLIPTSLFRTGSVIPPVWTAFRNLGGAYTASRLLRQEQTPIVEYIRAGFGPIMFLLLPLVVFYWKKLGLRTRFISLVAMAGNIMIGLSIGANRELFFPLFLFILLSFARYISESRKLRLNRYIVPAIIVAFIFIVFFTNTMLSRSSGTVTYYFAPLRISADQNNVLIKNLPEMAKFAFVRLSGYLSQGYYALYLSLEKPFIPMFGVGNSMFLTRQAIRITGFQELAYMSYPDRILLADGWDSYHQYTTMYPWIASDVSFPGVIVVMFVLGRLMAQSWLDTLQAKNPFAVAVFGQFCIMLIAAPTVNWVVNNAEGFATFWGLLTIWAFTRKRYRLAS